MREPNENKEIKENLEKNELGTVEVNEKPTGTFILNNTG